MDINKIMLDIQCGYNAEDLISVYYDFIPDDKKWNIVTDAYTHSMRDRFPISALIRCKKHRPDDYLDKLPEQYSNQPYIAIYRASMTTNVKELRKEISWTIDYNTAIFFAQINKLRYPNRTSIIYKAEIRPCDIICFETGRAESEIMQHCSVKNIEAVEIIEQYSQACLEKAKAAMTDYSEQFNQYEDYEIWGCNNEE